MSFLPKRCCDFIKCEIAKAVRVTNKQTIEYASFRVPRKGGASFHADLYPAYRTTKPASTFEEYFNGADKDPLREDFDPNHVSDAHKDAVKKENFMAKLGGNKIVADAVS
jgi:hypothetical protein